MPDVLAYIQSYDFGMFNDLLWTKTPEEVFVTFPLSVGPKVTRQPGSKRSSRKA